jgi:hypothetical protein
MQGGGRRCVETNGSSARLCKERLFLLVKLMKWETSADGRRNELVKTGSKRSGGGRVPLEWILRGACGRAGGTEAPSTFINHSPHLLNFSSGAWSLRGTVPALFLEI